MDMDACYCGVMNYSAIRPHDQRGVWDIAQSIRTASSQKPEAIRQLNLSHCRLDLMTLYDHESLATNVGSFTWLSVVKLNACGLNTDHMIALLHRLLRLPFMQGRNPVPGDTSAPLCAAEISIQSNEATDEMFRMLSEKDKCFLRTSPAVGVQKLDLSYNKITDRTVRMMARLTPCLTHLYLNGNCGFTGTHMEAHVTKFAPLRVLAMDRTSVDGQGLTNLLTGLSKRKASDACPLELWMRSMVRPPNDDWCPLLRFCGAKVDSQQQFRVVIKHDLQNGLGHYHSGATSQHECVLLKVCLNGWKPIEVKHFDVPSDVAIARLAVLAVNEITAVCLEDTTRFANTAARTLRLRYCAALKHVVDSGRMAMKVFKVDTAIALHINRYTKQKVVVGGMGGEVFGAPRAGWDVVVEVVVEEDTDVLGRMSKAPRR